jgi:hypothetical protein
MDSKDRGDFDQSGQEMVISTRASTPADRMPLICAVETDAFRPDFVQKLGQNYTPP